MDQRARKAGHLVFDLVTPGVDYHAGFVSGRVRPVTPAHTHDFYEMFYILEGRVAHTLGDETVTLAAGDLLMIRAADRHALTGKRFHMINVAFPASSWADYCRLVGLERSAFLDTAVGPPPRVHVPEARREECAGIFGRVLQTFQQTPQGRPARHALCRFWSMILEFFEPHEGEVIDQEGEHPVWLSLACRAMYEEENLRAGLARFVDVSGVTRAHLTRTLKIYRRQTPTEFINELRLQRAAMMLATTPADILDIAADCGFENISYFYRRFRRQFGKTPRALRKESQCIVMPLQK